MLTNVSFFLKTLFRVLMVVGSAVSLPNNTGAIYTVTRPVPHLTQHVQGQRCCMCVCHLTKPQSEIGHHYHSKPAI